MRHIRKAAFAISIVASVVTANAGALDDRGSKADQDACTPDVFSLCSNFIPDEPAILACLQGRKAQLSSPCADVLFPSTGSRRKRPVRS